MFPLNVGVGLFPYFLILSITALLIGFTDIFLSWTDHASDDGRSDSHHPVARSSQNGPGSGGCLVRSGHFPCCALSKQMRRLGGPLQLPMAGLSVLDHLVRPDFSS